MGPGGPASGCLGHVGGLMRQMPSVLPTTDPFKVLAIPARPQWRGNADLEEAEAYAHR